MLGTTRGEVGSSSANGTCIVHFSPASVLERTRLGQKQHQVTLGVRKPWGHLLHGVHRNRQAELPMGLQLPMANTSWEGSQKCAQLRWHSLCSGQSNAENWIPPISCYPSAFGNPRCRASSLSPRLHGNPFSRVRETTVWQISAASAQGRALFFK